MHAPKLPTTARGEPLKARPRPDADRAALLVTINAQYEHTLRHLGR
jgi:hypothetical protein